MKSNVEPEEPEGGTWVTWPEVISNRRPESDKVGPAGGYRAGCAKPERSGSHAVKRAESRTDANYVRRSAKCAARGRCGASRRGCGVPPRRKPEPTLSCRGCHGQAGSKIRRWTTVGIPALTSIDESGAEREYLGLSTVRDGVLFEPLQLTKAFLPETPDGRKTGDFMRGRVSMVFYNNNNELT
ncbi:hypothetical protein BJV78DRAFT_706802 [Lactifluus subvellereus]|nr:hypothetical protein BJV78DRAFT_706802 [Lactifluus subvellereus]